MTVVRTRGAPCLGLEEEGAPHPEPTTVFTKKRSSFRDNYLDTYRYRERDLRTNASRNGYDLGTLPETGTTLERDLRSTLTSGSESLVIA